MFGGCFSRLADGQDCEIFAPTRAQLSLSSRTDVTAYLGDNKIDSVVHAAARVGGIQANIADPVGFLAENLTINDGVVMGAFEAQVPRLVFLGSSCMYPRDYTQPLKEDYVLAAPLEPTNEGYALSKITGAKLCDYISRTSGFSYKTLIPCNLFGDDDHFGSVASHLIAAIVSKVDAAQQNGDATVEIWGTGNARREFLLVDDLCAYILDVLGRDDFDALPSLLNTGYGSDHSVLDYYQMVADIFGYQGDFTFDTTKPEGMMMKLMDSTIAQGHGWTKITPIHTALERVITHYKQTRKAA